MSTFRAKSSPSAHPAWEAELWTDDEFDDEGDLHASLGSERIYLARQDVEKLRDHLNGLLGSPKTAPTNITVNVSGFDEVVKAIEDLLDASEAPYGSGIPGSGESTEEWNEDAWDYATENELPVTFKYQKTPDSDVESKLVHPSHIHDSDDYRYFVGIDPTRENEDDPGVRSYREDRIIGFVTVAD